MHGSLTKITINMLMKILKIRKLKPYVPIIYILFNLFEKFVSRQNHGLLYLKCEYKYEYKTGLPLLT